MYPHPIQESRIMSEGQTHDEPAARYEIETAAEPRVRARRVLTSLRSIQDCHRSLMKVKEVGGLNPAEMEKIDEAISVMASLVGNVLPDMEAIVDALNPQQQQQLDQQGATSVPSAAAPSADESPGPLRRWILDRGMVILTVFTRILDLWLEDFVFSAMSRLVRRRWDGETEGI